MAEYIKREVLVSILNAKAEMTIGTAKQVFFSVANMVALLPAADVKGDVRNETLDEVLSKAINVAVLKDHGDGTEKLYIDTQKLRAITTLMKHVKE